MKGATTVPFLPPRPHYRIHQNVKSDSSTPLMTLLMKWSGPPFGLLYFCRVNGRELRRGITPPGNVAETTSS